MFCEITSIFARLILDVFNKNIYPLLTDSKRLQSAKFYSLLY